MIKSDFEGLIKRVLLTMLSKDPGVVRRRLRHAALQP